MNDTEVTYSLEARAHRLAEIYLQSSGKSSYTTEEFTKNYLMAYESIKFIIQKFESAKIKSEISDQPVLYDLIDEITSHL